MLRFILTAAISAALLAITACSTVQSLLPSGAPTPKATVAALESGLTAADQAALGYVGLPPCETRKPGALTLCSDKAAAQQIGVESHRAYVAVTTARQIVSDASQSGDAVTKAIQAAETALAAFQQTIPGATANAGSGH
jgi:hypothetical protein